MNFVSRRVVVSPYRRPPLPATKHRSSQCSRRLRVACEIDSEVSIRRRPPAGSLSQQCGPLMFEVENADPSSKPRNILEEIVWYKNQEIEEMRSLRSVQSLARIIAKMPPPKDFRQRLLDTAEQTGLPALIAEVKKASPSKGVIQPDFDPVRIARSYERGGAACLSVLTDRKYFQGEFKNLKLIIEAGVACPLLCKEFIIEAYQLFMARAHGADAVLLIAAVLPNKDLQYFISAASNLGMQCLIEVHNERELQRVSQLDGLNHHHLVGINNRSLETFEVDLNTTPRLLSTPTGQDLLYRGVLIVGESGIFTKNDLRVLHRAGCKAVLVGESLVRSDDQESAVGQLLKEHYLFYTSVSKSTHVLPKTTPSLRTAARSRLQREIQQLLNRAQNSFKTRLAQMWTDFEKAREKTMKGRIYKLAQSVLAREDPHETSFKKIPKESEIHHLHILYPDSLKEAFVRRRLRILLKQRRSVHTFFLATWSISTLPLLLLFLTPLPNLPFYYAVYRIYSNLVVRRRCAILLTLLAKSQHKRIHDATAANTSPDIPSRDPMVQFDGCQTMDQVLRPQERFLHPVSDDAILHISKKYHLPDLLELVARTRRKVTGAMFPHEFT